MVLLSNADVNLPYCLQWLRCQLGASGSREVCRKSMSVPNEDKEPAYRLYFYSVCTFRSYSSLSFPLSVLLRMPLSLDLLIDAKPYTSCACDHSDDCLPFCVPCVCVEAFEWLPLPCGGPIYLIVENMCKGKWEIGNCCHMHEYRHDLGDIFV